MVSQIQSIQFQKDNISSRLTDKNNKSSAYLFVLSLKKKKKSYGSFPFYLYLSSALSQHGFNKQFANHVSKGSVIWEVVNYIGLAAQSTC